MTSARTPPPLVAHRVPLAPALLTPTLLAPVLLTLSGCEQTCEGAGCEEQFTGALVGVLRGADLPSSGESSPLDTWATIAGGKDQGPDADVVLITGAAWIGTADDDSVRGFDLAEGGTLEMEEQSAALLVGENAGDAFGAALAAGPDWDGDGLAELLVGAPRRDSGAENRDEGSIYVYAGLGAALGEAGDPLLRVTGEGRGGRLGTTLVACGDMDGDGVGEIASSAPWDATTDEDAGLVWLGLSGTRPAAGSQVRSGEAGLLFLGVERGDRAGDALSCAHDLIGPDGAEPDGLADLVVGAPFARASTGEAAGVVYVIAGGDGLTGGALDAVATLSLVGAGVNAWQGWSVATGDLDGDGRIDLAAGAPGVLGAEDDTARGQVVVWDGSRLGSSSSARARVLGQAGGDAFGRALAIADTNADGRADLLVGAPRRDPTEDAGDAYEAGTLYLFRGREGWSGWGTSMAATDASLRLDTSEPFLRTGQRIARGDLDGDGQADLALALRYDPDRGLPE